MLMHYHLQHQFTGDLSRRGTRVVDAEAFCGRWSLLNPTILFKSDDLTAFGTSYGPVPLQIYGTVSIHVLTDI